MPYISQFLVTEEAFPISVHLSSIPELYGLSVRSECEIAREAGLLVLKTQDTVRDVDWLTGVQDGTPRVVTKYMVACYCTLMQGPIEHQLPSGLSGIPFSTTSCLEL